MGTESTTRWPRLYARVSRVRVACTPRNGSLLLLLLRSTLSRPADPLPAFRVIAGREPRALGEEEARGANIGGGTTSGEQAEDKWRNKGEENRGRAKGAERGKVEEGETVQDGGRERSGNRFMHRRARASA